MQFHGASGPVLTRANLNLSDSSFFSPKRSSSYLGERLSLLDVANTTDDSTSSNRVRMRLRITAPRVWSPESGVRRREEHIARSSFRLQTPDSGLPNSLLLI